MGGIRGRIRMSRQDRLSAAVLLLAGILILTWAIYYPGLRGPLVLDDLPQLGGLLNDADLDAGALVADYLISTSGPTGRPVSMATFIADAVLHGDDTAGWKHTNVLLHLLNGLLIFALVKALYACVAPGQTRQETFAASIVAGLWLLHPLNVSTVLYTVQRMTELSTLFVLTGMLCYVRGRLAQPASALRGWSLIALAFLVFYPLGVFSKENALLFPVYCTLLEFVVIRARAGGEQSRAVLALHAALGIGYGLAVLFVAFNFADIVLETYAHRDFSLTERILTQFRVLATYLSQILLPLPGRLGFFHDDIAVSTGFFAPTTTALSLLLIVSLLAGAIYSIRGRPLVAFGILFYFATHLIESTALGLELMFEHRNHLGLVGILLALTELLRLLVRRERVLAGVAVGLLVVTALLTVVRVQIWSSPGNLYVAAFEAHPYSPRVNIVLANAATSNGDYAKAREHLARTRDNYGQVLNGMFLDCLEHGAVTDAAFEALDAVQEGLVDGHASSSARAIVAQVDSGQCQLDARRLAAAFDAMLDSRVRSPGDRQQLLLTKARLVETTGDIAATFAIYHDAQAAIARDPLPTYSAADLLARYGQYEQALQQLTRADAIAQGGGLARSETARLIYSGLGERLQSLGSSTLAADVYLQATRRFPQVAVFYLGAAESLLAVGRNDEAANILEQLETERVPIDSEDQQTYSALRARL